MDTQSVIKTRQGFSDIYVCIQFKLYQFVEGNMTDLYAYYNYSRHIISPIESRGGREGELGTYHQYEVLFLHRWRDLFCQLHKSDIPLHHHVYIIDYSTP